MTGDVLPFAKSQHQRAREALPWFLMGTLEPDEEQMVKSHLQGCVDCRAQLATERQLQEAYAGSDSERDPEAALSRLRPRLLATREGQTAWPARLLDRLRRARRALPAWATLALATQLGIILALGWALAGTDVANDSYHALSSPAPAIQAQGKLVIVFDPGAPQQTVQALLRSSGARIVDGPLASGAYVLDVPAGGMRSALERLRAEHAVTLVELLQSRDTP
ncbi:conserved hypothetical protein [Burkholderiales bacterium]|nr:conserved hypothetical protein [Burkholderiales bacterium]